MLPRRTRPALPLALTSVLVLVACATGDGMQNKLQEASRGYNRNLRWGDIDRAAEYLPVSSRSVFMSAHQDVDDALVIVDYQVTRLELNKERGTAASRAEIVWHTDDSLIVRTTQVDQVWQWYEGNWVLVDEHRSGGKPLSVFAEPDEEDHPWLPGLDAFRRVYEIGEENRRRGRKAKKSGEASDSPPGRADGRDSAADDGVRRPDPRSDHDPAAGG